MAVKLRFARFGKRGSPSYRLVAIDEHKQRNGRAIEILGSYNPADPKNQIIGLKAERVAHWLSVGAKPSATVNRILHKLKK